MRPRSVIGPLLLIAVGVVLLAQTLHPQAVLWEILARYWPFVLVAWGGLRLVEILAWRLRGLPLPAAGISGGEWTVVVLICLLGSGLHAAHRYRPWERVGAVASKRLEIFGRSYELAIPEQRLSAPRAPRILVENLRGNTRITGGDTQELRVSGRKTVRALDESDAAEADRQTALEVTTADEQIVIRTNLDRVPTDRRMWAEVEIVLPRGAAVQVRGREGDLEAGSLDSLVFTADNGSARVSKVTGSVRLMVGRTSSVKLTDVAGPVEIVTRRGRDLEVEGIRGPVSVEGFYSGDVRFTNLAGPLRFQNAQITLRVQTVSGHIQMDLGDLTAVGLEGPVQFTSTRACDVRLEEFSQGAEISVDGGDIRLRPSGAALGPIHARTRSGDMELALPETTVFQLRARTARGQVINQFGPMLRQADEAERGAVLSGGNSGPRVELETLRGSITVRKDSGAPLRFRQESPRTNIEMESEGGTLRIQRH